MSSSASTQQEPLNYPSIDLCKWIAALIIVSMHSAPFIQNNTVNYFFTCFCRIAVPFFFVFSSFIFFKKKGDICSFIKRLLILYFVWFLLESPLIYHSFFVVPNRSFEYKSLIFLRGLLISSTFPGSWFITALWQGMLIVWWLSKKLKWQWMILIGILCALASLPGTLYYGLIKDTALYKPYWLFNIALCPAHSFITAIPFCIAGKLLAEQPFTVSTFKKYLFLILSLILGCVETVLCKSSYYMSDTFISLFIFAPVLLSLLLPIKVNIHQSLALYFRKTSILIYLIHLPVIFLLSHYFQIEKGVSCWVYTLLCAIGFSTAIYLLSKRIPILKRLY